jgi:hypothetical protein
MIRVDHIGVPARTRLEAAYLLGSVFDLDHEISDDGLGRPRFRMADRALLTASSRLNRSKMVSMSRASPAKSQFLTVAPAAFVRGVGPRLDVRGGFETWWHCRFRARW